MRWLIVDGDAEFRDRLSRDFHFSDDHENVVVADEKSARQVFGQDSFDGVVADWPARGLLEDIRAGRLRSPGMDGTMIALVLTHPDGLEGVSDLIHVRREDNVPERIREAVSHFPPVALLYAASDHDPDNASLLLKKDPKLVNAIELPHRWTPLHRAVAFYCETVAELLLQNGADPNAAGRLGEAPLHIAGSPDIARLLIRHGAKVHLPDQHGNTPMDWAVKEKNQELIVILAKALPELGTPVYQLLRAARRGELTIEAEYHGQWGIYRILTIGWTEREERCLAIQVSGPAPGWSYLKVADLKAVYLGPESSSFPPEPPALAPRAWVAVPDQR
ncbi:MAG: ankyrin repeat domain-containing protein [Candidatus Eremiobacteraeota bacterium]|nr:ankyrin repeat domain-containing protein [Candidatus Eremiobacteraeota bacterium]MCW5872166.1 ankyrin repeat domain-containing protein [Candidatus Eremiobacteraeota bacterium]